MQKEEKQRDKEMILAALKEEESLEEIDQKDDGYIELVLRVLARMCDGQHEGLQVTYILGSQSLIGAAPLRWLSQPSEILYPIFR